MVSPLKRHSQRATMPHGSAGVNLVRRSKSSAESKRTSSGSTRRVRSAAVNSVRMFLECHLYCLGTTVCIMVADAGGITAATWISTIVESSNYEVQTRPSQRASPCFKAAFQRNVPTFQSRQYVTGLNTHAMQVAVAKGFVVGSPAFLSPPKPRSISSFVVVLRDLQPPCSA